jgi:hypothetical protein
MPKKPAPRTKSATVWCVVHPDGKLCLWTVSKTRKGAAGELSSLFRMTPAMVKAKGFTVRKYLLTPIERAAK